ncbi:conserved protein of unknown function [Candidatus Hydrogenisulfobacillus filiaventi]|uniref:Uncharacterized protein n=1 Tax=Candidatus Hydrogenisulfobacillus filiaventi TaxID=2707344 RepID=A0A6F8ZH97_9FIRM|nr:hypothetical protein [Bacillota bacterium]CAB1129049.1 conserved protein of unknown function [Candidatus Hydrogenisulfobacillus filiaventi]
MSDWGGWGPLGPLAEWAQGMMQALGPRGLLGLGLGRLPEGWLEQMDPYALRSLRRHLLARRQDLDELIAAVEDELARREAKAPEPPPPEEPD